MTVLHRLWCRLRGHQLQESWIISGDVPANPYPGMRLPARRVWRCLTCQPEDGNR